MSRRQLTDGIELNAGVTQFLRIHYNLVLRFAVSNKDTNLTRIGSQTHIWFEVVLEDVVQGHPFGNTLSYMLVSYDGIYSNYILLVLLHFSMGKVCCGFMHFLYVYILCAKHY